jgi:hypothetical protein
MCPVNKPPRPKGVKAWDIDRFDKPDDSILYGWDFVGTQEQHDQHELVKYQDIVDYLKDMERYVKDKAQKTGLEHYPTVLMEPRREDK